jgi:hypothetical protein
MGDPLRNLAPGDAFPTSARTWNPVLDLARKSQNNSVPSAPPIRFLDKVPRLGVTQSASSINHARVQGVHVGSAHPYFDSGKIPAGYMYETLFHLIESDASMLFPGVYHGPTDGRIHFNPGSPIKGYNITETPLREWQMVYAWPSSIGWLLTPVMSGSAGYIAHCKVGTATCGRNSNFYNTGGDGLDPWTQINFNFSYPGGIPGPNDTYYEFWPFGGWGRTGQLFEIVLRTPGQYDISFDADLMTANRSVGVTISVRREDNGAGINSDDGFEMTSQAETGTHGTGHLSGVKRTTVIGTYQRYVVRVYAANLRTLGTFALSNVQLRIVKCSSGENLRVGPLQPATPGWPPNTIDGPQEDPGVEPEEATYTGTGGGVLTITGPTSGGGTGTNENFEEIIE